MPFDGSGTFQRLYNWEADAAASPPIGISPVRFDNDGNDVAAALTNLKQTLIVPANFLALLTATAAALPTTLPSSPGVLWNNGGTISIS